MKITADVNSINRGAAEVGRGKNAPATNRPETQATDQKFQNNITRGLQRERAQIDALIIAQVSRDLVQKAITISARLQSAASEAITTGKIDTLEVRNQVSFIEGDIADYGGAISAPVGLPIEGQNKPALDISDQFRELSARGRELLEGAEVDPAVFKKISDNLAGTVENLNSRIGNAYSDFRTEVIQDRTSSEKITSKTSSEIVSAQSGALTAQGNINADSAASLTLA